MAKFFDNNLRPEELAAGYNVGEPDDDIFQIKDKEYPEDIQQFIYAEPEPIEEVIPEPEPIEEVISEPLIINEPDEIELERTEIIDANTEESDNNIWDSFGDEPVEEAYKPVQEFEQDDLLSSTPISPIEIIEEIESTEYNQQVEERDDILSTKQDIQLELDDDFKKRLAEQLAASKAKKKDEPKIESAVDQEAIKPMNFVPVEEEDNAQYYDLTEFGNERPSEKNKDEAQPIGNTPIDKNEEVDKQNKKKSKLPKILGLTAASIVVLLGLSYLIMYYLVPNFYHKDEITHKDSSKVELEHAKLDTNKAIEKPKEEKVAEKIAEKETEKKVEKQVDKKTEDDVIAKINQQYAKKNEKIAPEPKKEAKKIVEPKVKVEKEVIAKKEKPIAKKEKVEVKEKPVITKESKIPPKKEEKKIEIAKETKVVEEVKKEEILTNAVYTIQVYSSPSKEDALDWVNKLKSKNIQANLSEQMIRDVKWYRVRFGSYSTREEAKAVALRYGFSQTWIDRIK